MNEPLPIQVDEYGRAVLSEKSMERIQEIIREEIKAALEKGVVVLNWPSEG